MGLASGNLDNKAPDDPAKVLSQPPDDLPTTMGICVQSDALACTNAEQ